MYNALKRTLDNEIFKGTKAVQFVRLIEEFSSNYAELPVSDLLSSLLNESGYEMMLRTEGRHERLDNLAELKQFIHEYETRLVEKKRPQRISWHMLQCSRMPMRRARPIR